MTSHTPVCELLGIDHPIAQAPVAADPRLPAAVSNAGGLGSLGLSWSDEAGDVVRETAPRKASAQASRRASGAPAMRS
jgi:nitronate monooxygenase